MILESLKENYQVSKLFGFNELSNDIAVDDSKNELNLKASETLMKMLLKNIGFLTVSTIFIIDFYNGWDIINVKQPKGSVKKL